MAMQASQAHAVEQVVKHLFVAVVKASSQDDIFEDLLEIALVYLRLGVDLSDHISLVDILICRLNILYLIELSKERTLKQSFLKEEHKEDANVHQRFIEATYGF